MKKKVTKRTPEIVPQEPKKKLTIHPNILEIGLFSFAFVMLFLIAWQTIFPMQMRKREMSTLPKQIAKRLASHQAATNSATFRVPILMYHYVEYVHDQRDTIRKSLALTPFVFEKQLQTLIGGGYTFITTKDMADVLDGKARLPDKPIILTFDDGYGDFYTDVFPLLKKYNARAVAYIVPGFSDKLNYMTSAQVGEVAKSGIVEIAAHTMHHVWLKGMSKEQATYEIEESKKMLEANYGIPVVSFAYPYGAFDAQAAAIAKKVGFRTAVSTVPGIESSKNNQFFLYRIRPGGRTGQDFLNFLSQSTFKAW